MSLRVLYHWRIPSIWPAGTEKSRFHARLDAPTPLLRRLPTGTARVSKPLKHLIKNFFDVWAICIISKKPCISDFASVYPYGSLCRA
jgi:hypothetical protein